MRGLIILTAAALLAGCATQNGNHYADQLAKLEADCQARQGIITPTGRFTGRPPADFACVIRGGSGRLAAR